jgi:hypothetical protein
MTVMAAISHVRVPRFAGAAFVAQFCNSLAAGLLVLPVLDGNISEVITAAGADASRLRLVVLLELLTGVGILFLTSLLYVALRDTVRWVATIAFAFWLAEATILTVRMIGLDALLDLGGANTGPASAVSASDAAVGTFAVGVYDHAGDFQMLLFCVGALLWYSLFVRTRFVPRWLGIWGLASVVLVCVATLLNVWDRGLEPPIVLYAAYVPFELVVGIWLLVKGSPVRPAATGPTTSAPSPVVERSTPDVVDVRADETTRA